LTNYPELFKSVRGNLSLTQPQFADKLAVSLPTVQNIESGKYEPSRKILACLDKIIANELMVSGAPKLLPGDPIIEYTQGREASSPSQTADVSRLLGIIESQQRIIESQQETIRSLSANPKSTSPMGVSDIYSNVKLTKEKV